MPTIHFKAPLVKIGTLTILKIPRSISEKLPSRGQIMVNGTINSVPFQAPLEPDGSGSHWLKVSSGLQKSAKVTVGDMVTLAVEPTKDWPEPTVPADLQAALGAHSRAQKIWASITPMARWEWIRWVSATKQPETRKRRITATCSKLITGNRRPCCFNRSMCCVPEVSKNGVLLEPK